MRSTINLHILQREFAQLSESAYFDKSYKEFSSRTLDAIEHVLSNVSQYPWQITKSFESHLWNARTFVRGSRAGDAPYEVQYALKVALRQWMPEPVLISSAELENINFYLIYTDLWDFIRTALTGYDTLGYAPIVVRIGSPGLYKYRPVFCIPLFHELGHFLDFRHKVTETSMLMHHPAGIDPVNIDALQQAHRHRMEHFADLFAACYSANSLNEVLLHMGGLQGPSPTHPSTADRLKVVDDFLAGNANPTVDILQSALAARGLPSLSKRYDIPDVAPSFDDVLVYRVLSDEQLFGLFPAAWSYLERQLDSRSAPWITTSLSEFNIESTVNDLTQKSLRNFEITKRWRDVVGT